MDNTVFPAWMTITNKENGPYQAARTGLHGKLERSVLQVDRGAEATQDSTHAQADNECNKAEKNLAERSSNKGPQQLLGGPVLPRP